MNKKIQQIFIFFLPTIIVVMVSIYSYQQLFNDNSDDSSDIVTISKVELPTKNIYFHHLPISYLPDIQYWTYVLESKKYAPALVFVSQLEKQVIKIDNLSPPPNIFA